MRRAGPEHAGSESGIKINIWPGYCGAAGEWDGRVDADGAGWQVRCDGLHHEN